MVVRGGARPLSPAGVESELSGFDGADLDIHAKLCRGRWPHHSSYMASFDESLLVLVLAAPACPAVQGHHDPGK